MWLDSTLSKHHKDSDEHVPLTLQSTSLVSVAGSRVDIHKTPPLSERCLFDGIHRHPTLWLQGILSRCWSFCERSWCFVIVRYIRELPSFHSSGCNPTHFESQAWIKSPTSHIAREGQMRVGSKLNARIIKIRCQNRWERQKYSKLFSRHPMMLANLPSSKSSDVRHFSDSHIFQCTHFN